LLLVLIATNNNNAKSAKIRRFGLAKGDWEFKGVLVVATILESCCITDATKVKY
jgi:hypothetical protein